MILQDLFEESGYRNIINEDNAKPYHLSVDVFYNEEGQIPSELKFLYISKTKDELFFVLDVLGRGPGTQITLGAVS